MYSIINIYCLSVSITLYNWIIFGCFNLFNISISLASFILFSYFNIFDFSSIFIATFSPVCLFIPRLTEPKAPSPNFSFRMNSQIISLGFKDV